MPPLINLLSYGMVTLENLLHPSVGMLGMFTRLGSFDLILSYLIFFQFF